MRNSGITPHQSVVRIGAQAAGIGPPSFRPMDFGQIILLMRTEAGEIAPKGRM